MRTLSVLEGHYRKILYLLVTTPLALFIGLQAGKFLLPWIQAAAVFPLYYQTLSKGFWKQTASLMAGWALLIAVLVGLSAYWEPGYMESSILNAAAYRNEMFQWISTGIGPEGNIRQFLPQHASHFAAFSILTLLSGGFLGLVMGSALMNYMSFYVGVLLLEAESIPLVLLLAWPPWAIARVTGFILAAMAGSMLVFQRFRPAIPEQQKIRFYALLSLTLLLLDVVLKWCLAGTWQELLKELTGL